MTTWAAYLEEAFALQARHRNGPFAMRGQWASSRGEDRAARFIRREGLQAIAGTGNWAPAAQSLRFQEGPG